TYSAPPAPPPLALAERFQECRAEFGRRLRDGTRTAAPRGDLDLERAASGPLDEGRDRARVAGVEGRAQGDGQAAGAQSGGQFPRAVVRTGSEADDQVRPQLVPHAVEIDEQRDRLEPALEIYLVRCSLGVTSVVACLVLTRGSGMLYRLYMNV